MRNLIIPILLIAAFSGCDIIDQPKGETASPVVPGGGVTRNVLLEDCTGHLCPNCPQAALIADQLKGVYGDRLVVVAVHMSSTFAAPQVPLGDGVYDTDFRTPAGNEYETTFQVSGLPKGLIDRTPYNNLIPVSRSSWSSAVAQLIDLPASVDLWFDTLSYNSSTNMVSATVKAAVLNTIPSPQHLTIYLTEDHIIDWQEDGSQPLGQQDIENYEHRHVLRAALNSPWGEAFIPADAQPGDTLVSTFTYPLPAVGAVNQVLNTDNCALVAYVSNSAGAAQYEVQQVTERKFVP